MALPPGHMLGPFEVLAPVGAGGMGEVYRARDPRLEREVALKVLPAATTDDDSARRRLLREARLASKLSHPHICTVYEVGEADGEAFIAMELVEGESLSEKLAGGPLPPEQVVRYGRQVADALDHAHQRGVVHRDLKAANVVITPEGQAKVLDFGLAGRLSDSELTEATTHSVESMALEGKIAGTLAYMAPEQLRGRQADARSDIWALGVMLYEMAAGARPFKGTTGFELSSAILSLPTPPLPETRSGKVPAQLEAVIDRCLEKDPDARFQSACEVRAALETAASGRSVAIRSQVPSATAVRRWILSAAAVAVAVAALLWLDVGGIRQRMLGGAVSNAKPVRMAVLPFSNLSGDPEQKYLSDGFTQEMITQLGRLHPEGLSVIARTSVMRYKGGDTPIDRIGRELSVDYILEGSTQREGDRVRINAELIHVGDQTQLWADTYERELEGVLALQSEVAQRVAESLALELLPAEQARLTSARPVNPEAYEAYLKGTYHWQKMTLKDMDIAQNYFELALEKDPEYAPAYEGLAIVWGAREQAGAVSPAEAGPKSMNAALRAVELDPNSAKAHEALALAQTWRAWDWVAADKSWQRTLELNPNGANAHAFYAHYLLTMGRLDEAVQHSERAIELDPFNSLYFGLYGAVLWTDHRLDDALAALQTALEIQPDNLVALWNIPLVFAALGMHDELVANQRMMIGPDPELVAVYDQGLAEGGFENAQRNVADLMAERYEKAGGQVPPGQGSMGIVLRYLDAGEYDRVFHWLEVAYEEHDPNLPYLCDPVYDPIRTDPRFEDLAHRMGLPHAAFEPDQSPD